MLRTAHALVMLAGLAAAVPVGAADVPPHPHWRNALQPRGRAAGPLTLATDGAARCRILLPARPSTVEEKAAADLAHWLREITGAEFPVVREGDARPATGATISVGWTRLLAASGLQPSRARLSKDGYALAVKGNVLFITGGRRRGPINGVYCFLEEDLGCRWYAPRTQTIPHSPTLVVRPVPRTYTPVLEDRRCPLYSDVWDVEWSLRNKTYSHAAPVPSEWGGHPKIWGFVHTFDALVPPGEYFASHPEYFSEIKGKRQPFQLCMTHPDVLRIVIEKVRAALKADPALEFVEVSPNDRQDYCECRECKRINDAEGTYMGALLTFVNRVADAVKDDYPRVKINTLAYLGTIVPPRTIVPRKNVSFWMCTDAHAWSRPNDFVWETEKFSSSLRAWHKKNANIIIWDYPSSFAYLTPNINMPVHQANLKYFIRYGATGVMFQCSHDTNYGADHSFLRSWVWAKQLWDPDRDTLALMRDFNYGYYGLAGPIMHRYDLMLWDAWKEYRRHRKEKDYKGPLTPAFVTRAWELLQDAERAAANDPELLRRVKVAQMPLMYLKAAAGPKEGVPAYLALLDDFEKTARAAGVRYVENAFQGPDIDRKFSYWRKLAQTDPDKIGFFPLGSTWRFAPDEKNVGLAHEWFRPDFDDSKWAIVRSDKGQGWEAQGFEGHHGYGWYRQRAVIPESTLAHEGLRMLFLAVDEEAEVFINGQRAFEHTVASTGRPVEVLWTEPFLFDPKPYLKPGENTIAVRVHDTVGMGGIWKPVYLVWGEGVDESTIERVIELKQGKQQ